MTNKIKTIITISAVVAAFSATAHADRHATTNATTNATKSASVPVLDIEIDPIAYALSGYSVHVGLSWNQFRLDVGVFGADMPEAMHGVKGLDVRGTGYGMKLDYYPLRRAPGLFFGMQLSRVREQVTDKMTTQSQAATHTTIGARVGYRINVGRGFYALPWVGIDVSKSDRTQNLAGNEYKPGRAILFPTVHFGKRF